MKEIEVSAKSYELALAKGLEKLNTSAENVDVSILNEGGGLFKKVTVLLKLKTENETAAKDGRYKSAENKTQAKAEIKEAAKAQAKAQAKTGVKTEAKIEAKAKTSPNDLTDKSKKTGQANLKPFLEALFKKMSLSLTVEGYEELTRFVYNIKGENANVIIGYRGEVLDAIQYLVNLLSARAGEKKRIDLDVEGYRAKREASLENLARSLARKAAKNKRKIKLEPMNPYERRVIHSVLQDDKFVTTSSEGEEPNRCVVILPNNIRPKKPFNNNNNYNSAGNYNSGNNYNKSGGSYKDNNFKENREVKEGGSETAKDGNYNETKKAGGAQGSGRDNRPYKNRDNRPDGFKSRPGGRSGSYDKYKKQEPPKKLEDKFYDDKHYEEDDIVEDYSMLPNSYNKKDGAYFSGKKKEEEAKK